jgi:DNA-binding MarR family transcriptional regulator
MAGHLIRRLNQISVSVFTERVSGAGFDLTPVQFAALNSLKQNPGIDQASLAGLIAYDRVTIGGVVDRLEQKGFLRRVVSARDRRARELFLTELGDEVLNTLTPIVTRLQDEILKGLQPQEKKQLMMLLEKATSGGNELSRAPKRELK